MLHVTRLTAGAADYYLADLAAELAPALRAGTPGLARTDLAPRPGRWTGRGSAGLGLAGPVESRDLAAVLSGRSPASDRSMVARRGPVCGYDLTFTAPKSVSLLFALGTPEVAGAVLSAHVEAVDATMDYVARRALAVRRGSGEDRRLEPVGGVVGAAFTHGVSRALDPHLHTHVVVANLGHGPDGRWTAVDGRGLFAHAPAAGRLYGAHLRHQLTTGLGVEWLLRRNGSYEVEGVDPMVLGGFSGRRAEILAHLADRSPGAGRWRATTGDATGSARTPSRRANRVAWAVTREPKGPRPAPGDLARLWSDRATALGLSAVGLDAVLGRRARPSPEVDEYRFAARLAAGSPHATATRRDTVDAWAGALRQGAPAGDVERCVDHLVPWGGAVGVGEPSRALSAVVPPPYHLRALGPRPASPQLLGVWLEAATAVARYRSRWDVTDALRPLGVEGSSRELSAMGARRLADHLATARRMDEARRQLGRALDRQADPPHLALGRG